MDQCEEEYEKEIQKKRQEFDQYMAMLTKETEELKDTRDEYRRETDKLEKMIGDCKKRSNQYQQEKVRIGVYGIETTYQ